MVPRHMSEEHERFSSSMYPDPPHGAFSSAGVDIGLASEAFDPRFLPVSTGAYSQPPFAIDALPAWTYSNGAEMRAHLSPTSETSPSSSAVGSPRSTHDQPAPIPDWAPHGVMSPSIVDSQGYYAASTEYSFAPGSMDDLSSFAFAETSKPPGFVDPSLIHPDSISRPLMTPYENGYSQTTSAYPHSPALTSASPPHMRTESQSPYLPPTNQYYLPTFNHVDQRRPSVHSFHSGYSDSDAKEKQRCPHPECGKVFKDLKAHMLTHQNERPEKCPITTCEYHIKGFARKYDKNRHTLTHYKGTMVCGFCPGSGSAAEKSFNRADVFKRHLTAVHGVEQTPPNSRKNKNPSTVASTGKKPGAGYADGATGKCSTCTQTFSNAQDFYEHLDDCVLRIVQQEDPAEAINARRLAEVENDEDVLATLAKNSLPTTTQTTITVEDEDDDAEMEDEETLSYTDAELQAMGIKTSASPTKKKGNPANGVQKSRGMTHSRGGVSLSKINQNKGRKNRREYPSSWGFDKGQMVMKKRTAAYFDGSRRLAKDDMMLSTEHEVRIPLSDGQSYVTDLDIQTLRRAEGFLNATEEEKGLWVSDDPTEAQYKLMLDAQQQ
ncbi:hypothetical protein N0V93_006958 [Gnomoniopsis smithogilvyi]|uniref:C2H2-type domain-containing protein n=1 Tax=Gnomoniopsis smithogilvyi TaxID=1191159 RepID=A0A9W8YQD5_9PEZI|nr:hypothetical protein N0V93_006958 [Gnomoniopsis smithogilvyi]